jgi:hypothetical protein
MGRTGEKTTPAVASEPLPGELHQQVDRLRQTFGAIVEAVCGGSPRAQDVTDSFGLHRKLGWQIWNVAYSEEANGAVRFVPNARGIDLWRAAAAQRGVPDDLLRRLDDVIEEFQQLVETHAEDREMLEMIVESGAEHPDEAVEQRWRKQAFTGNSFIWGVRAKSLLATVLLHPSVRPGYFDMVRIQGLIGFVRTRATVRWPFAQSIVQSENGTVYTPNREPVVASKAVKKIGVPLMEEFCSQPLPAIARRTSENGMLEDELLPGPVGQTAAGTIITGELAREVAPYHPTHAGEFALWGTGVRTPGEVLISDHFVHREMFPNVTRELRVFGELISNTTRDERDRLPVAERLQHLGRGLERVRTAEIPRYAEILGAAFEKTGWKPDDFDVYRVRMRYPPIPVSVMVRHEMPLRNS